MEVVINAEVAQSATQAASCNYWDYGAEISLVGLPDAVVRLRVTAAGYATRESTVKLPVQHVVDVDLQPSAR